MLNSLRYALAVLGRLELAAAVGILAAIVLIILSQVFSRYVVGRPLIWAEEMATYLLIWLGFIAASIAYKMRRHITIQSYDALVGVRGRAIADVLIHGLILVLLGIVVTYVPDAMRTERMQSTVGLPQNVGLHWFFTVPTLVTFLSMMATAAYYVLTALSGLSEAIIPAQPDPSLNEDIIPVAGPGRIAS